MTFRTENSISEEFNLTLNGLEKLSPISYKMVFSFIMNPILLKY